MNDYRHLLDDRVGAHCFEYAFEKPAGSVGRYALYFQVGDDPDWRGAHLLMPGAQYLGQPVAVFEADSGAMLPRSTDERFTCWLHHRGRIFWTVIHAETVDEARARCRAIGGLVVAGDPWPTRWQRLRLFVRYWLERRPQIRLRQPLDIFRT